MFIEKIILKEKENECFDVFSAKHNLFFSKNNSQGKTTYFRLILYGFGYDIPSPPGINFHSIGISIFLVKDDERFEIKRSKDALTVKINDKVTLYSLPDFHLAFLNRIFGIKSAEALKNIIGLFYIDQDYGWNLFDTGRVIGNYKFDLGELVRGLSNIDVSELKERKKLLLSKRNKYSLLLDLQKNAESSFKDNGDVFVENINNNLVKKVSYIDIKINKLESSLKELDNMLKNEQSFYNYINSLNLYVKSEKGEQIPVNSDTLLNATDVSEYNKARRSIIAMNIERLKKERSRYSSMIKISDFQTEAVQLDGDDKQISNINRKLELANSIDQSILKTFIVQSDKEIKIINNRIYEKTKNSQNSIELVKEFANYFMNLAKKIQVDQYVSKRTKLLFRLNTKKISGAILQKINFIFRISVLKMFERKTGIKLFLLIDSPRGKELDDNNAKIVDDLIKEEFNDYQVFIASLHNFSFNKKIIFRGLAIDKKVSLTNN